MKPTAPQQQSFSPTQVKQVVGEFGDQVLFSFLISSSIIMNDTKNYDFWLFLLKRKFLTRRDFASQGICGNVWTYFCWSHLGVGRYWHLMVSSGDAVKRPTKHGTASLPKQINDWPPNINSVKDEDLLCSTLISHSFLHATVIY